MGIMLLNRLIIKLLFQVETTGLWVYLRLQERHTQNSIWSFEKSGGGGRSYAISAGSEIDLRAKLI